MNQAQMRDAAAYAGGGAVISGIEAAIFPPRKPRSKLSPPAPVFGVVWSGLFTAFGMARGRLRRRPDLTREIDVLWLLCAFYPLYTGGLRWRGVAFASHAAIAGVAGHAAARAAAVDRQASRWIWPVIPWVAYATLILATEPRGR